MSILRTTLDLNKYIIAPAVEQARGPKCMTCGLIVPYEQIVEDGKYWVKVLARCHGAEELATFDFGSVEWDYEMLRSYRMRKNWFDPTLQEGIGVKAEETGDEEIGVTTK